MDALMLWMTSDQEVEIGELQRQMGSRRASGDQGDTEQRDSPRCNDPLIGSAEWIDQMDWLETEGAAHGRCFEED